MNVFWKTEPLNEKEIRLMQAVFYAHSLSANRANMSSQALLLAHAGSGDYLKSLAAALMTLEGTHAPIEATCTLLLDPEAANTAELMILAKKKVPGWGNSFVKGGPEPIWEQVVRLLELDFPETWARVQRITERLHSLDLNIFPNPSTYTAATAIAIGLPAHYAAYLFIAGRLESWTGLLMNNNQRKDS